MKSIKTNSRLILLIIFFTSIGTVQAQEKWNGKNQK